MKTDKIFIAGHQGVVGSALCRELLNQGYRNLITCPKSELDLSDQSGVLNFLEQLQPDVVFIAAGKNGLLSAYDILRADFIYQNLMIQANLIHGAWRAGVKKLFLFAGDDIYPQDATIPIAEEALLTGSLAESVEAYALAKISGIKMLESYNRQYGTNYLSLIHSELYGPHLSAHSEGVSVVMQILEQIHLAKMQQLKKIQIMDPDRIYDLLYVDDFAKACLYLLNQPCLETRINIGANQLVKVKEISQAIVELVGYRGALEFLDSSDVARVRCLQTNKLTNHGWTATISLKQGLKLAYAVCLEQGIFDGSGALEPTF